MDDLLLTLAMGLSAQGDHRGAALALHRLVEASRSAGDLAIAALVLEHESAEWWKAADVSNAYAVLMERLDLLRRLEDSHAVAEQLLVLAFFPGQGPSLAFLEEAKALAREKGYADLERAIAAREALLRSSGLDFL